MMFDRVPFSDNDIINFEFLFNLLLANKMSSFILLEFFIFFKFVLSR